MSLLSRLRLAETQGRPPAGEVGSNAVSYATGNGQGSRLRNPEYKYELVGRQGGKVYQRMRWSDPHIAGLRRAQNLPLLRASVNVEAAEKDDKDAVAKAELVKRLLIEDFPWRSFLQDTCLALDYGFAPFEIVWRMEDGEARCRLALRPADSISAEDIYVKDGTVEKVIQRPDTGGTYEIPGEKLVWFCNDKEGDNFLGRPILRAMYKPWLIKEQLEVELPELMRKLGGIPDITTQGEPSAELAGMLDQAAESFGVSAGGYFRHDDTVTVQLLTGSANVADLLAAVKERNTEITSVCQAQVFDLGTSNSGSRALGSTLSDLFADSIQAQASYREDVLNAKGAVVHQLVAYNFPKDDNLPKLRFGNVQAADMSAFALALFNFSKAFGTLDEETQDWARQQLNMPEGTTEQVVVPTDKVPPVPASSKPAGPGADAAGGSDDGEPEESGAQASETHTHGEGLRLSELRPPRGVECYVALAEVAGRFDDARTAISDATMRARDRLAGELVTRAAAAQAKGQLAKFAAGAPPMVDALKRAILPVLRDFYEAGRSQVRDELQRQRDGAPVVEEAIDARQAGQRVMAAEKPKKPAPLPDPDEAMDDAAEMAARTIATRAQVAAAAAATRTGSGVPLDPVAAAEAVAREADAAALRMFGVVSDLMSLGRSVEMEAQAQEIADYVYSAILDGALCENCEPMDGEVTLDAAEAATWAPNPDCLGGDRCRCVVIAEIAQEGGR